MRRTIVLSEHVRKRWPDASQLIVTGSPLAHDILLPSHADYLKLPAAVKVGDDEYRARSLALDVNALRDLRAEVVMSAVRHLSPEVVVVDHVPTGLRGEVVPTLRFLKQERPRVRLVAGLRDVVDEGQRVRRAWRAHGVYELLDDVYDLILVYGDPSLYDPVREYGLSEQAAAKTRHVGYVSRRAPAEAAATVRKELGFDDGPLVLVTAGGGGDGRALVEAALGAARLTPAATSMSWLIVGGPLMPRAERELALRAVPPTPSVRFERFVPDLPRYVAAADAVVSMGGYNTVAEILASRRPALIVPRVAPSMEQLVRARTLRDHALVRMVRPAELSPGRLLDEVTALLREPPSGAMPSLDGARRATSELAALLAHDRSGGHRALLGAQP